ncbi:MAG: hypothetical protein DHS20C15_11990 [Planctomycetota bacterium]|nr:MAG: hypothetical protein DHS20C15_11990 [Planctomycetota bacterium]
MARPSKGIAASCAIAALWLATASAAQDMQVGRRLPELRPVANPTVKDMTALEQALRAQPAAVSALSGGASLAGLFGGSEGSFDNFGRLVDVHGSKIIVADDNDAYVFNTDTLSFESGGLLADSGFPAASVHDVAIFDDQVMITFYSSTFTTQAVATKTFDGLD